MPRYDVETFQKGAGEPQFPLIPQDAAEMALFADEAAARTQPLDVVRVEAPGVRGRLLDMYRRADGQAMGLVKTDGSPRTFRVVPLEPEMVGLPAGTELVGALMPRLVSREVIPARLLHRDEARLTGRVLDVWVNPEDPVHLMGLTATDDTPAGLALQEMMAGRGEVPALGARSIEVDSVPGAGPGEPKGRLTGIVPTAVPRMAEARQEVRVTEEMGAKGGSSFSFHTPLPPMSVAMNTIEAAVENMTMQTLDTGAEEHGIPVAKKQKPLADDPVLAEMKTEMARIKQQMAKSQAEARVAKAKAALLKLERDMAGDFDSLVRTMEEQKSASESNEVRRKAAIDIVKQVHADDKRVVEMAIGDETALTRAMDDFAFLAESIIAERAKARAAAEAKEAEAARQAEEQQARRLAFLAESRKIQAGSSASFSFNVPAAAAPTAPPPARTPERDQTLHVLQTLRHGLVSAGTQDNFSFGQVHPSDARVLNNVQKLLADGVPLEFIVPRAGAPKSANKRTRTD